MFLINFNFRLLVLLRMFLGVFDLLISDTHTMADGSGSSPPTSIHKGADPIRSSPVHLLETSRETRTVDPRIVNASRRGVGPRLALVGDSRLEFLKTFCCFISDLGP